jgi:pheromone a factor receptor
MCFRSYISYVSLTLSFCSDYIVQGHRFDIVQDFGCRPTTYVSLAAIFILWLPLLLFSAASFVLSGAFFCPFLLSGD